MQWQVLLQVLITHNCCTGVWIIWTWFRYNDRVIGRKKFISFLKSNTNSKGGVALYVQFSIVQGYGLCSALFTLTLVCKVQWRVAQYGLDASWLARIVKKATPLHSVQRCTTSEALNAVYTVHCVLHWDTASNVHCTEHWGTASSGNILTLLPCLSIAIVSVPCTNM